MVWGVIITARGRARRAAAMQRFRLCEPSKRLVLHAGRDHRCLLLHRNFLVASPANFVGLMPGDDRGPEILKNPATMLYVSIGIIGATVMPHVLYLHSSIVRRAANMNRTDDEARKPITLRNNYSTSSPTCSVAVLINAAILGPCRNRHLRQDQRHRRRRTSGSIQRFRTLTSSLPDVGRSGQGCGGLFSFAVALLASGTKCHHCRHACRPGGDGRLHQLENQPVAAAFDYPGAGHYPRRLSISDIRERPITSRNLLVLSQVVLCMQLGIRDVPRCCTSPVRKS